MTLTGTNPCHPLKRSLLIASSPHRMSPTIFQFRNYRFFFFSREEPRVHVHVYTPEGEAKFWLEPKIELAINKGIRAKDLKIIEAKIREREHEIRQAWKAHFES